MAKNTNWENELKSLETAIISLKLEGYKVHPNHNGFRKKTTFFLQDDKGNSITGSWNYIELNHFILGYGRGLNKLTAQPVQVNTTATSESKNHYAVTVHIVMEADSEGEASDSMTACLTENLEMSGAILDWGYSAGGNAIDLGLIDKSKYEEGDFISVVESKAEVAKRYHAFTGMLEALKKAQAAFRRMYDDYEGGKNFAAIHNDESYWPLSDIRTAIESATTK